MAMRFWLFESFEESVLGGFVHSIGGCDDKETVVDLAAIRGGEKLADLLNANNVAGFAFVGTEVERRGEMELQIGRDDKNTAAGLTGDVFDGGNLVEKHNF